MQPRDAARLTFTFLKIAVNDTRKYDLLTAASMAGLAEDVKHTVHVLTEFALQHDLPNLALKHLSSLCSNGLDSFSQAVRREGDEGVEGVANLVQKTVDAATEQIEEQMKEEDEKRASARDGGIFSWIKARFSPSPPPSPPPSTKIGGSRISGVAARM